MHACMLPAQPYAMTRILACSAGTHTVEYYDGERKRHCLQQEDLYRNLIWTNETRSALVSPFTHQHAFMHRVLRYVQPL